MIKGYVGICIDSDGSTIVITDMFQSAQAAIHELEEMTIQIVDADSLIAIGNELKYYILPVDTDNLLTANIEPIIKFKKTFPNEANF